MKTLCVVLGPNGVGKTTACEALLALLPRTAYVDSDAVRRMNPFVLNDDTVPTVIQNLSALIQNDLNCPALDRVLFSYGWHGRRREIYDAVLAGLPPDICLRQVVLTCEPAEHRRRLSGRDEGRQTRALEVTRPLFENTGLPTLDVTCLTPEETALRLAAWLEGGPL